MDATIQGSTRILKKDVGSAGTMGKTARMRGSPVAGSVEMVSSGEGTTSDHGFCKVVLRSKAMLAGMARRFAR